MITVILYSRLNCHLCDQTKEALDKLRDQYPHELRVVNIDEHRELQTRYGLEIPIVEIGPYHLKYPFTLEELKITLGAAINRSQQIEQLKQKTFQTDYSRNHRLSKADKFSFWLSNHYMLVFNGIVSLYLGFSFLAPLLMHWGFTLPAKWLYKAYGVVCHQLSFRSWFLFGEQPVYPRSAAGIKGLLSYEQVLNPDEGDLFYARELIGNPVVGYKVALCQRDVAIYWGILLFGLVFSLSKNRIKPLPWYLWVVLGILPVGFDGLSQLFSQPPFSLILGKVFAIEIPYRESTPFLRTLTGGLFGITTAWFGYPMVEESMKETRSYILDKLSFIKEQRALGSKP